jgi:protein-tyrosine-phosphatase
MLKILFLCTENACRSQMAEGLVNHYLAGKAQAFSAGVAPGQVNPNAIRVMGELGIDISQQRSKSVSAFTGQEFDLVITVCDKAKEQCPFFRARPGCSMSVSPIRGRRRGLRLRFWRPSAGCETRCGKKSYLCCKKRQQNPELRLGGHGPLRKAVRWVYHRRP